MKGIVWEVIGNEGREIRGNGGIENVKEMEEEKQGKLGKMRKE